MSTDVLTAINQSRMTSFQYRSILICAAALMMVGYDVALVPLSMPYVPVGFFDSDAQRGLLLGATPIGMALGSFFLAPLADKFGRRGLILITLLALVAAMAGSGLVTDVPQLVAVRVFAGTAIGGVMSSLFVFVQEQSSTSRRSFIFGLFTIAFSFGGVLASLASASISAVPGLQWQSLFLVGAAASLLIVVAVAAALPESVDFLLANEGSNPRTQAKLDHIISRLGNADIDRLARPAPAPNQGAPNQAWRSVLGGGMHARTFLLWGTIAGCALTYFFLQTWMPQLVTESTGDRLAGSYSGLALNVGTVLGSLALALLSTRSSPFVFNGLAAAAGALGMLLLAWGFTSIAAGAVLAAFVGACVGLAQAGANAVVSALYPATARATAQGWLQSLGFAAGFTAPAIAGLLLAHIPPQGVICLAAIPPAASACAAWALRRSVERSPRRLQTSE